MQHLSNTTESDSDGYFEIQSGTSQEDLGWQTYYNKKEDTGKLIKLANNKVKLEQLFDYYKIKFDIVYSPSGWTHRAICPFPDHRENSPSFGYNPEENRFNCFGCGKAGASVSFKAEMDKISSREAAEILLDRYEVSYDLVETEDEEKYCSDIDLLLLDFSNYVRNSEKDYDYIEKVTWNLDVYIQKHVISNSLEMSKLSARIELLKEKLK